MVLLLSLVSGAQCSSIWYHSIGLDQKLVIPVTPRTLEGPSPHMDS